MKTKNSILLLLLSFSLFSFSQTIGDYIDVIYLKNGSKIKGIIIEQVPGKTIKIETKDGSEYVYEVSELEKFTRELATIEKKSITDSDDKLKYMDNFRKKEKGYFAELELQMNSIGRGIRNTHGYRFGRFGNLGLALGLETINIPFYGFYSNNNPYGFGANLLPVASLNLVYSGELLNKRITPFYQIEAGYGFSLERNNNEFFPLISDDLFYDGIEFRTNYGGPMAGIALGVKFHTKKKIYYKLSLDAKLNSNFSDVNVIVPFDPLSSTVNSYNYKDFSSSAGLGIRFGIGF